MPDLADLEARAADHLEHTAFDYLRGGADDEVTLAANPAAWDRLRLRPHVLRDVSVVSTATTVLGASVDTPVLVAPTAYHELASPQGESGTAAGTAAAGSLMTLSTFSTQTLERVAAAAPDAPRWFQMYVYRDRTVTLDLAQRAAAAGYRAIVLTVDVPVLGHRRRDERNAFALPPPLVLAHMPDDTPRTGAPTDGPPGAGDATDGSAVSGSMLAVHARTRIDPALTFDDIGWLGELSGLPVVVKGVLRADDAIACLDHGAAAIWVSNHGGRQLDGAIATADALPPVVAAVAGRAEVYVDGGIRTGTDALRALALGARAVMVGRPVVYGLALDGAAGVEAVLRAYTDELARAMALCGARTIAELTTDLVVP